MRQDMTRATVIGLMMVLGWFTPQASAMLNPSQGRFMQRDPLGYVDGMNVYQCVRSAPLRLVDPYGNWGSDVHRDLTVRWALAVGFHRTAAESVGNWDEQVDANAVSFGPGWAPIVGDQSYHFNRNSTGMDSRLQHFVDHLAEAKRLCNWRTHRNDEPDRAVRPLGIALHPLQDWVAHGDYGYDNVGVGNFEHHNAGGPVAPGATGKVTSYPDDVSLDVKNSPDGRPTKAFLTRVTLTEQSGQGTQEVNGPQYAIYEVGSKRITLTETKTRNALEGFQDYVRANGKPGCWCWKWFGVN